MAKRKSWQAVLMLMLALVIVIAGCSGGNNNNNNKGNSGGSTNSGSSNAGGETTEKPKDKVTFTIFNGVAGEKDLNTNETRIGKILEDQTGVNFKIEHVVGDLNTKIGTMVASNDYPDIVIPDAGINQLHDAGAFIDLTDAITGDKYPNLKKVYEPYLNLMKQADGKVYWLPFAPVMGEYVPDPNIGQGAFWIQRRVLEEAGYPKVKTVDEYFQLIEDYVAKHADEKLTGFITLTHDWRFFATTNVPNHIAGFPNDGEVMVDMNTLDAKLYAGSEYDLAWWKKLNEINAKGLLDKASFVDNYDQYIAKLTSHKVVGFFDYGWQVGNATNALTDAAKADPSLDGYRYFPLPVTIDGRKDQYLDPPGFVANRGMAITVDAKDPERILEYLDNLLKEENQILKAWGIEGETYLVDENGRFYRTQEMVDKMTQSFNEEFGFTTYDWDWPAFAGNSTLSNGNSASPGLQPEIFQLNLTDADKKILEAYGVQTYSEMFALPDDRPWFPAWGIPKEQGSMPQMFETRKTEVLRKYIPELVLSAPGNFDKVWGDYKAELDKLGIPEYEQWYSEQIKEVVAKRNA